MKMKRECVIRCITKYRSFRIIIWAGLSLRPLFKFLISSLPYIVLTCCVENELQDFQYQPVKKRKSHDGKVSCCSHTQTRTHAKADLGASLGCNLRRTHFYICSMLSIHFQEFTPNPIQGPSSDAPGLCVLYLHMFSR